MLKALGLIFRFIRKQKHKRKALKQHHRRSWTAAEAPAHLCQMGWLAYTSRVSSAVAWRTRQNEEFQNQFISLPTLSPPGCLVSLYSTSQMEGISNPIPQKCHHRKVYPTLYPKNVITGLSEDFTCNPNPQLLTEAPSNRASQPHGKVINPAEDCGSERLFSSQISEKA